MASYPYITTNLLPTQPGRLVSGSGALVTDEFGTEYIDLTCQTLNLSLGHCAPAVTKAVNEQANRLWFASSRFGTLPFTDLSKRLVALAPESLSAINLKMCNGSDAVETAVKLARLHTRQRVIICLKHAWHGESSGTLGFSSKEASKEYVAADQDALFSREATLASLIRVIEETARAAAVLLDPAGVSVGLFAESEARTCLIEIRRLCDEKGILLIFDEVQTFGGYLGTDLFASSYFGVTPDIACLGKALGAGLPLAATLCGADLRGLLDYNNAEFTSGGQALACAAGLAALDEYQEHKSQIAEQCRKWGATVDSTMGRSKVINTKRLGFITTLARSEPRFQDAWAAGTERRALAAGLIVRRTNQGANLLLKPPIKIPETLMRRVCAQLTTIAEEVDGEIRKAEGICHKACARNANEPYVQSLLARLGAGFRARTRDGAEQEYLSHALADVGVPVGRV